MKGHLICVIATAFYLFLPALPCEAEIDRERMRQDLDIMEGILQNLHAETTSRLAGIQREPHVRGLYFEDYGVVLLIEEPGSSRFSFPGPRSSHRVTRVYRMQADGADTTDFKAQREKKLIGVKNRLADFLGTYADAVRQLTDDDRISILVFLIRNSPMRSKLKAASASESNLRSALQVVSKDRPLELKGTIDPERQNNDTPRNKKDRERKTHHYTVTTEQFYLEATTKKSNIVAYRRERINEAQFRKRIDYREHRTDGTTMKKIGVMAAILDMTLNQPAHLVPNSNRTAGIYQEGMGAIFFVKEHGGYRREINRAIIRELRSPTYRHSHGNVIKSEKQLQNRLKGDLIEVVGDYGYSLRTLKPSESIVVDVRFPKRMRKRPSDPRGLVLMVKKQDIDAYARKDIDLAAFREKVDIQEY